MALQFEKFEEQVFFNTILIHNLTDDEFGTGFLISKKVNEKEEKQLLFSNKHVFWGRADVLKKGAKKDIKITLHERNDDGSYDMGSVKNFQTTIARDDDVYTDHPDDEIDVGCLNLSDIFNKYKIHMGSLGEKFFDFDYGNMVCGNQVYFVGYPSGFYDEENFLPIFRSGAISSMPTIDFNGKKQILIDAQVYPGSSGSPVFAPIKGEYRLIGILSQSARRKLDYVAVQKPVTKKENEGEKNTEKIPVVFIGLGLMYKTDTIKQVLELA